MKRENVIKLGIAFTAIITMIAVVAAVTTSSKTTYGNVVVINAYNFSSNGNQTGAWYWITDNYSTYGIWNFTGIPNATSDGRIYIRFDNLVTDTIGGSGYDMPVKVMYTTNLGCKTKIVQLHNTHPELRDTNNTFGYGYGSYSFIAIPVNLVAINGTMTVELQKTSFDIPFHSNYVAVNQNSTTIEYKI